MFECCHNMANIDQKSAIVTVVTAFSNCDYQKFSIIRVQFWFGNTVLYYVTM